MIRSSGHKVTALDLGALGIKPLQALQLPHQSDYFKPLMAFMASLLPPERIILVAHSLVGLAISKAMETYPEKIFVAVFVTAIMPGPSLNISALITEDLALVTTILRPIYLYTEEDMSKELILSKDKYGLVNRVYIISVEDEAGNKDVEQWMIQRNPPNEVREISRSDHMVMMSRPFELFHHLLHIAHKYATQS